MIEFGELNLDGYRFTLEPYNMRKHDFTGHSPILFWIRVTSLPYRFFRDEEFKRIVDDLGGGILLDVDPRSSYHLDFCYLRLRIGMCDRDVIPKYRKLKFTEINGNVTFYHLKYDVEDNSVDIGDDTLGHDPDIGNSGHKRKPY
jgi:hypothetical protein